MINSYIKTLEKAIETRSSFILSKRYEVLKSMYLTNANISIFSLLYFGMISYLTCVTELFNNNQFLISLSIFILLSFFKIIILVSLIDNIQKLKNYNVKNSSIKILKYNLFYDLMLFLIYIFIFLIYSFFSVKNELPYYTMLIFNLVPFLFSLKSLYYIIKKRKRLMRIRSNKNIYKLEKIHKEYLKTKIEFLYRECRLKTKKIELIKLNDYLFNIDEINIKNKKKIENHLEFLLTNI